MDCCVEGCKNLTCFSGSKNKSISFHLFPKNIELKKKWLRVIGRLDWNPPDTAHVCSAHFSRQQMVQVKKNLWTIKEDACPDIALPVQPMYKTICASDVEVCRMCLATNVKMFSLKNKVLKTCIETIAVLHQNRDAEGLPQFVCYLCAGYLLKTNTFIEKSMIAQATLLEIYAENSQITKPLVKEQNRQKLNLIHSLQYNSKPTKVFDYKYDDDLKVSVLTNKESFITEKNNMNGNIQDRTKKRTLGDISFETNLKDKNLITLCKKLKKNINSVGNLSQDIHEESFNEYHNYSENTDNVIKFKSINKNVNNANDSVVKNGSKEPKDNSVVKNGSKDSKDNSVVKNSSKELKDTSENESKESDSNSSLGDTCNDNYNITSEEENFLSSFEQDSLSDDDEGNESQKDDKENKEKTRSNMLRSRSNVPNNVDTEKESQPQQPDRLKTENIKTNNKQNTEKETNPLQKKEITEYFDVVELALDEQIKEWDRKYKKLKHNRPGTMQCYMCSKLFIRREAYVNHLAGHDPDRGDSECPVCKLCYANDGLLIRHIKFKHFYKYHCKYCPHVFSNATSALKHRRQHETSKYKCKTCGMVFESATKLEVHTKRNHPPSYACSQCAAKFSTIGGLRSHISHVHTTDLNQPTSSSLRQHKLRHKTPEVKCDECESRFFNNFSLRKHIERKHTQPKSERESSKSKRNSTAVETERDRPTSSAHREIILTNETFYKCHECDEMFRHYTSLEQHVQNVHLTLTGLNNGLINNEYDEDINDTETIVDDITKEYLELEDDDIDDSNFKFSEINHVTINDPIIIETCKTKNGKKKSKVKTKWNEKEYLVLREVENIKLDNMEHEFEEIESVQDASLTEEEGSQDCRGLDSEDDIVNGVDEEINDTDERINNQKKEYHNLNQEFVEDQEIYEDLEVLEIDELEENIES